MYYFLSKSSYTMVIKYSPEVVEKQSDYISQFNSELNLYCRSLNKVTVVLLQSTQGNVSLSI